MLQAKQAFAARGFEATNLTEHILAPAGVSVGSFYHQFANKREVLMEIFATTISERRSVVSGRIQAPGATGLGDSYRSAIEALLDDVERDPLVWQIQWREYENPDPEIHAAALIGVDVWIEVAKHLVSLWYPPDNPNLHLAGEMLVYLGAGIVREFAHLDRAVQVARRAQMVDACITFADAGVERLMTSPPV